MAKHLPLQRSTTTVSGNSRPPGMSALDIKKKDYDAFGKIKLPTNITSIDDMVNFHEKARTSYINWEAAPPPQDGSDKSTFKEVFDAEQYRSVLDKLANKGGSRRRRRPSRKYKKSKRVFRKKSRSTRRR